MSDTDALRHLVDDMHTLAHRRGTDDITMPQHLYNDNDRVDSQWNTAYVAATRHWVAQLEKALGMTTKPLTLDKMSATMRETCRWSQAHDEDNNICVIVEPNVEQVHVRDIDSAEVLYRDGTTVELFHYQVTVLFDRAPMFWPDDDNPDEDLVREGYPSTGWEPDADFTYYDNEGATWTKNYVWGSHHHRRTADTLSPAHEPYTRDPSEITAHEDVHPDYDTGSIYRDDKDALWENIDDKWVRGDTVESRLMWREAGNGVTHLPNDATYLFVKKSTRPTTK